MPQTNNESEIEYSDSSPDESGGFIMNREEVEYIVHNIQNEFLCRDTYYLAVRLIRRMREFLGE